jgi:hypothetical protein
MRYDGRAYMEHGVIEDERIDGVLFRSDTYFADTGDVGPLAAADPEWVKTIHERLKKLREVYEDLQTNWPQPRILISDAEEPYALLPPRVDGFEGPYANWTELAEGYDGLKVKVQYPEPDDNGVVNLMDREYYLD